MDFLPFLLTCCCFTCIQVRNDIVPTNASDHAGTNFDEQVSKEGCGPKTAQVRCSLDVQVSGDSVLVTISFLQVEGRDDVALTNERNHEFSPLRLDKIYNPVRVEGLPIYRKLSWRSHPTGNHRIRQVSS